MSDLIRRQEAIDAIKASASKYKGFMEMEMYTDDDAVEAIEGLPSADAVPVKHAKLVNPNPFGECSICGYLIDIRQEYNYCPNCGAKMDGERKDG